MLQAIRDRAQGIIAWVIIIIIIIPFALWGINQYTSDGKEVPVATVNDASISAEQLQTAVQQQRQRLQQMLGANYRPEMFAEESMKKTMLDGLVERELIVQAAHAAGMRVSNAELAELIRGVPAFQVDGKFSQAAYERALRMQGLSPQGFEAQLRQDLLAEQVRNTLEKTAFATQPELDRYLRLQNQTRDFGYLTFPADAFAAKVTVSDDEVKRFYEENKSRFMVPETVKIAYLELSAKGLAAGAPIGDDQIRQYYDAHKEEFTDPESRRASHILFRVEPGASADAEQAARKKAEDALKRLRAGESFAALAKQLSEDPGSASQGGDLGFFGKGVMDKTFEETTFSLKKGELSEPVRSAFGYHIIRVEEVRGGGAKPLEQVRAQIAAKLGEEKAQERFYELAEKLSNLTYEHADTLQIAAEELKLPVQHSGYFARSGGPGVAANQKVVQAAFSEEVLERGNNSDAVEVAPNHLVVLRVEDRRPETLRPLEEIRSPIEAQLRRDKARAESKIAADKALEALKKGADPVSVAGSLGGEWKTVSSVTRNDAQTPRPIVETAFRMPAPKAPGQTTLERAGLPSGDEAVVVLSLVQNGPGAAPDDKPAVKGSALVRADADASYEGVVATLRKRGDVKINEDRM